MDRQIDSAESLKLNADQQQHATLTFESPTPSEENEAQAQEREYIQYDKQQEVLVIDDVNIPSRNRAEDVNFIRTGYIAPGNSFEIQEPVRAGEKLNMEVEQENFNVECDLQSPKSCSDFGEDVGEDSQEKINGGGNQQNHMEEDPESPMVEPEVSLDVSRNEEDQEIQQKELKEVRKDMLLGNEKELNEITSEYESEMQILSQQPTLSQLQKSLEDLCQAFTIDHDEKDSLEKRIEKAVEWATNYLKALERNKGELGELIDQIQTIRVRLDEMEKALEYRKEWRLWRLKIMKVNSSLQNKVEDIFEDARFMVPFENLKEIIEEEKIIQHVEPDDGLFQHLKETFEEARKLRKTLNEQNESLRLDQLVDIKEKLHKLNVSIPELRSLQGNLDSHLSTWKEDSHMIVEPEVQKDTQQKDNTDPELLMKIQKEGERVAEWKKTVEEFLALNYEESLLKLLEESYPVQANYEETQRELADVAMKARHIENELKESVDLTQEKKAIQKVLRLADWILNVLNMRQQLEEEQLSLNYEKIKGVVNEMDELRLPKFKGLCILVVSWHDQIEEVRGRYIREYQQKRRVNSTSSVENVRVKNLIGQNVDKIDLNEAENVLEVLKSIESLTSLKDEIQTVTIDIKSYQAWRLKINATLEESQSLIDNVQKDDAKNIQVAKEAFKLLNELKAQMMLMPLRDVKDENDFCLLEWIFQTCSLIGSQRKDCEFEEWKKLLWEADALETEDIEKVKKLKDLLVIELGKANKIKIFLEKLKVAVEGIQYVEGSNSQEMYDEKKASIEELNQALKDCEECKIALKEEKRDLERVSNKYNNIKERVQKLLYPEREKAVLREFTSLQEHIAKLSIRMSEEYNLLNEAIQEASSLEGDSKAQVWDNFDAIEDLIDRYSKCPVFIIGLAKMEKIYEETKQRYDKVKSKESAILEDGNTLSFEELEDLGHELERLEANKIGSSFTQLKKRIYVKKIQLLLDQHLNGFETATIIIPYRHLQALLAEGRDLKRQGDGDKHLNNLCFFLDSVLKEADKRMTDLEKLKDVEKLDQMNPVILRFVDIGEQIIERKASLTCEKPKTQEIHFIDYEKDYRLSKGTATKERETSAKKKGRPRKGEERTPKKERDEGSNERKRRSKERSREKERLIIASKSVKDTTHTKSWVRVAPEEKPIKKLTHYFDSRKETEMLQGLMKTSLNNNHPVLMIFIEILEACEVAKIRPSDSSDFAREVIKAVPQTVVSRDVYNDIKKKLKNILEYKYITQSLINKRFDRAVLKTLFQKDDSSFKNIDKALKEKKSREVSRTPNKLEEEVVIRKSKKTVEKEYERDRSSSAVQKAKKEKASTPKYEVMSAQKKTLRNDDDSESLRFKSTGEKSTFTSSSALTNKKASVAHSGLMSTKKNLIFDDEKSTTKKTPVYEIEIPAIKRLELENLKPAKKKDLPSYKDDSLIPKSWEKEESGLLYKNGKDSDFGKKSVQSTLSYQIHRKPKASELYDPETTFRESVVDTKSNRADRLERLQRLEKKETKEEKRPEKIPSTVEGTILRIFEGSFEFDKDRPSQKITLFTCDSSDKVSKIPLLGVNGEPKLEVHMKLPKTKVETYLNSIFSRKEDGGVNIVSGWIESRISLYQSRCDHIAKEMLELDQMATISYDGSSRIIIMHKNQMHNEWKNQLDFRLRKVQKTSNPTLYFVITSKTRKLKEGTKFIQPVIEQRSEKSKKILEREDSLSVPSSIEDYEEDFGAEIDDKPSLASSLDGFNDEDAMNYEQEENDFVDSNKRSFKEFNKRHVSFDVDEDQIVKKVKPNEIAHKKELIEKLREMESEEIIEYATRLDPQDRETIMNVLASMGPEEEGCEEMARPPSDREYSSFSEEEEEDNTVPENSDSYRPPFYIQNIYNLFTKEQLRRAQNMLEDGPQYQITPLREPTPVKTTPEKEYRFLQEEIQQPTVNLDLDRLNALNYPIQEPQLTAFPLLKTTDIKIPQQELTPLLTEEIQIRERVEIEERLYVGKTTSSKNMPSNLESTILQLVQMQQKQSVNEVPQLQTDAEEPEYSPSNQDQEVQMSEEKAVSNETLIIETTPATESIPELQPLIQSEAALISQQKIENAPLNTQLPVKIQYKGVNTKILKNRQQTNKNSVTQEKLSDDIVLENDETQEKDLICGVKLQGNNLKIPKAVWEALSVLATQPISQLMAMSKPILGSAVSENETEPISENKEPEVSQQNEDIKETATSTMEYEQQ